jgi:DNA-binding transcriptional regulator YiaG
MTHLDLAERCLIHADKADDAGLYTTANVLWLAAQALKVSNMNPDEIRAARRSLGMTHRQFGQALGVQEQTARRWEIAEGKTSNRAPSETVLRLIRVLLATNPRTIPEVENAPTANALKDNGK